MSTIRYGLIGAGYLGKALVRALNRHDDATITAIFDPLTGDAFAAEFGATVYADWKELCAADDVDAVIVASPNWAHHEQVVEAARLGKAVFCEKPVALSYEHTVNMVEAARASGSLFMVGHVTHFMSGVRRAKELIAEGAIGDIVFCRAVRNTWEGQRDGSSWKKQQALSGGHLYHHIHELDLVLSLLGEASTVTMVGGNVAHRGVGEGSEDDVLAALLEYDGTRFAAIEYGSAFRWTEHYVLIEGTLGAIRLGMQGDGCELRTPDRVERFPLHRTPEEEESRAAFYNRGERDASALFGTPDADVPLWMAGILEEETDYFHALMLGGEVREEFRSLTDGSAALASLATADAMMLSQREGRKAAVTDITAGTPANV
ncbi:Gfo/Idh/MocA family protein [Microterricola pindariensis]|uniref:Oxidoreductase n=1 Tax=Microterricola pindariensis TaxID=478010 RepID=A0ABX5AUD2_9MICO|nr:Gfo/Idh/MocA family oxidoreductase [Microterricola pindariensis]PPL18342.1 oxidoreductase [Microterricola pindariensis]